MTTKLKQQNIKLATRGADTTVVYKEVKGLVSTRIPFALTPSLMGRSYTLTHIPSGYSFGPSFDTQREARAALEILEAVVAEATCDVWGADAGRTETDSIWIPTEAQRSVAAEFKRRLKQ